MTKKERELVDLAIQDAIQLAEEKDDRVSYRAQDIVVSLKHAVALDEEGDDDG